MIDGPFRILPLAALALASCLWIHPAASQGTEQEAKAATEGPGRGALAGFVVTPQVMKGGNGAFLIAPNSSWFIATSAGESAVTLIEMNKGVVLRSLTKPGLKIAGVAISPDSNTIYARGEDGTVAAWDVSTGHEIASKPSTGVFDITRLSFLYDDDRPESNVPPEPLSDDQLSHLPDLKKYSRITFNPTREYAIIAHGGTANSRTYQIRNLRKHEAEITFSLVRDHCGPDDVFSFDYDGKHIVFGNQRSGDGADHDNLDFATYTIDHSDPEAQARSPVAHSALSHCNTDWEQTFAISPDTHLVTRSQTMPDGKEWIGWDARNGEEIASIEPDGHALISSDGRTIVVFHEVGQDAEKMRQPAKQLVTVQRNGTQRKLEFPTDAKDERETGPSAALSSNGRWIALRTGEVVTVRSSADGKVLKSYRTGEVRTVGFFQVSNDGEPLIGNRDGTVFANGAWKVVRTDVHGLIIPLTAGFHAQCGPIFCDRVVAGDGVVERVPRDEQLLARRQDGDGALSPDGRFVAVWRERGRDIIDIADGHLVLHLDQYMYRFARDGRSIVAWDASYMTFVKYDLPAGQPAWTMHVNRKQDGFYMVFPDGRVRYSKTPSFDFALVRGFEVRPFDRAAAKQFVAPLGAGVP